MNSFIVLVILAVLSREIFGDNKTTEVNDLCVSDIKVGLEGKFINSYNEKEFQVCCKLHEGFESIQIRVESDNKVINTRNFSAKYYNMSLSSLWQRLHVKLDHKTDEWTVNYWLLSIFLNEKEIYDRINIGWDRKFSDLKSIQVFAYGHSEWRFYKPGDNCTALSNEEPVEEIIVPNSLWILVSVLIVIVLLGIVGVVLLIYKIKHPKNSHLPQVSFNASNSQIETRNGNGQNRRFGRPGSYNSINSLYGVI